MNRRFGDLFWQKSTNLSTKFVDATALRGPSHATGRQSCGTTPALAQFNTYADLTLKIYAKYACNPYRLCVDSY
jgi:hypothetical protein